MDGQKMEDVWFFIDSLKYKNQGLDSKNLKEASKEKPVSRKSGKNMISIRFQIIGYSIVTCLTFLLFFLIYVAVNDAK